MVQYTGEDWQKDILARDWLNSFCLINSIAGRLYKDIYSATDRERELLKIPEMRRLQQICYNECKAIDKLSGKDYISLNEILNKDNEMNDFTNDKELVEAPFNTSEGEVPQPKAPEGETESVLASNS